MRYRIDIEYDGSSYSGWQIQPNAHTIQQEIEKALSVILRQNISITGSGRTDAGVHARGQVAHFDVDSELDTNKLLHSLFGLLPRDIAVYNAHKVSDSFHSRFDAKDREYHYFFTNRPLPLMAHCTTIWWQELDLISMQKAAAYLIGDTDCTSFTPSDPEQPHLRCLIYDAEIIPSEGNHPNVFKIRANRFLRSVVRSIMGTLAEVGRGRMTVEEFENLIKNPDRRKAGPTAPARGLILNKVRY